MMKTLTKYISHMKDLHSLNEYLNEKLVINRDFKEYAYTPKTWNELRELVRQRYKELGPGTEQNPIDFNDIDVSKLETLVSDNERGVFQETEFKYINVSNWNVSNIKNMKGLFFSCNCLVSVGDISDWDVSGCEDMSGMFCGCWELKQIDVSNWNIKKVRLTDYMFAGCQSLNSVGNLSHWDISSLKNMNHMFYGSGIKNMPSWYKG